MSSPYTASDVTEANRLWDEMPLPEVSERTGIPDGTLGYWSEIGLISTDTDHRTRAVRSYDKDTIEKAERLWDVMPLTEVSDLIGVPLATLYKWSHKGWISTEMNHCGAHQTQNMTQKCRRAAHLAYEKDITNREAARRMGVAESTFYRYLRLYRNGTYC
jgi:predicted site-specific integrase-resolvase